MINVTFLKKYSLIPSPYIGNEKSCICFLKYMHVSRNRVRQKYVNIHNAFCHLCFLLFFLALDEGDIALLKTYVSIYYIHCNMLRRNKKIKVVL